MNKVFKKLNEKLNIMFIQVTEKKTKFKNRLMTVKEVWTIM